MMPIANRYTIRETLEACRYYINKTNRRITFEYALVRNINDTEAHAIQSFDLKTGKITQVAGSGQRGDGPDGDPMQCKMNRPHGVFVDKKGIVYVADSEAHRIRKFKIALR